jgi:replication factor A1
VVLSDGEHYIQGMLGTQLNHMCRDNTITDNALVQIKDFMTNQVQNRTVIIVLGLDVIPGGVTDRIGTPMDIEKAAPAAPVQSTAPVTQPMYNRTNVPAASNPYSGQSSSYGSNNPYGGAVKSEPPIVRSFPSTGGTPITPVSALNMYQNRWTIKCRVTSKSDIRTWSNAKGEGSLFSIEMLCSSGVDIRATFFKEAVDKFYNMLEVNQIYTFSGGRLKVADIKWNTCKSTYEITFDQNSEIHKDNDDGQIKQQLFDFVKIADIEQVPAETNVDLLCVVKTVGEVATLQSKKTGKDLIKCDLTCVDDSGVEVNLTIWGDNATKANAMFAHQPVVAFRRARVSDYGGKSLSTSQSGAVVVDPSIPEAHAMKAWWATGGAASRSLSSTTGGAGKIAAFGERKNIKAIKAESMGYNDTGGKPEWLAFKGTVTFIKKDKEGGAWYTACPNAGEPCKNRFKVTQTTDNRWYCDKCQGTFDTCVRRWIFSATVADDTSTTWVSFFNEQAETLFEGTTADSVFENTMQDGDTNQDAYDSYFLAASHTDWIFKCKVMQEMVGDESRVKTSVYTMHPVDYAKESRDLLEALKVF